MFGLIHSIIDHVCNGTSSNTTEQSIIYFIFCLAFFVTLPYFVRYIIFKCRG